jgi:hypothetical protein
LGEDLRQRPDSVTRSAGNLDSFCGVRHHCGRPKISAVAERTKVVVFNASTLVTYAITFAVIGNHEVTFWAFESKDVAGVGYAISQKSLLTSRAKSKLAICAVWGDFRCLRVSSKTERGKGQYNNSKNKSFHDKSPNSSLLLEYAK